MGRNHCFPGWGEGYGKEIFSFFVAAHLILRAEMIRSVSMAGFAALCLPLQIISIGNAGAKITGDYSLRPLFA